MKELTEKQKKKNQNKQVLQSWHSCVKNASLYAANHPTVVQSCKNFAGLLEQTFSESIELTILNSDAIFIIDDELFIEESILMFDLLHLLEEAKVVGVSFLQEISDEEIRAFVLFLLKAGKEKGLHEPFTSPHIRLVLENQTNQKEFEFCQKKQDRIKQANAVYTGWLSRTEDLFEKLFDEQTFHLSDLSLPLERLIDDIHLDPETFAMELDTEAENLHVKHAVDTMILSIHLGNRLGYDLSNLKLLAVSALLHDTGRFLLPPRFESGYHFSKGEREIIHNQTVDGAAFLAGVPGLPIATVRVALETHRGYDGLGYPALPPAHKNHIFSDIVGLASFISWKTVSERFYHRPTPRHRLIRTILRRMGSQFHPLLVKILLPLFGLYPPGTRMRLKSGVEAISLEPNVRNIIRPYICTPNAEGKAEYHSLTEFSDPSPYAFRAGSLRALSSLPNIKPYMTLIPPRELVVS